MALRVEMVLTDHWMPLRVTQRLAAFRDSGGANPPAGYLEDITATTRAIAAELGRPEQGEVRVAEYGGSPGAAGCSPSREPHRAAGRSFL